VLVNTIYTQDNKSITKWIRIIEKVHVYEITDEVGRKTGWN